MYTCYQILLDQYTVGESFTYSSQRTIVVVLVNTVSNYDGCVVIIILIM